MGQTILIVEDDKDLRENICSILQNEGFQTTEAQNHSGHHDAWHFRH